MLCLHIMKLIKDPEMHTLCNEAFEMFLEYLKLNFIKIIIFEEF